MLVYSALGAGSVKGEIFLEKEAAPFVSKTEPQHLGMDTENVCIYHTMKYYSAF